MTSIDEALPISDEDHTQFGQVYYSHEEFVSFKNILGHFYVWHLHKNILLTIMSSLTNSNLMCCS